MKTSSIIVDINGRSNVVSRASMHVNNPTQVNVESFEMDSREPLQVQLIHMVSHVLASINSQGIKGRVSILVPESIAYRMFQAKQLSNRGQSVKNLVLPWMTSAENQGQFVINDENGKPYNVWVSAIEELASYLDPMFKDPELSINFVNSRTLYRFELRAIDGVSEVSELIGDNSTVNLINSIDESKGLVITENNFLNGELPIRKIPYRDRNGEEHVRYYVDRVVRTDENGEALYANGAVVLNARTLRIKNAEQLPRQRVIAAKEMKVQVANAI